MNFADQSPSPGLIVEDHANPKIKMDAAGHMVFKGTHQTLDSVKMTEGKYMRSKAHPPQHSDNIDFLIDATETEKPREEKTIIVPTQRSKLPKENQHKIINHYKELL